MAVTYGGTLDAGVRVMVVREGSVTRIETADSGKILLRLKYPALLSLIARLSEAAKDAAKER